ncbi:hypothetical protein F4781DRAFT_388417 [Annulohypoxylon bovei var. microspora]|nr:hypothetical protein F4781DRAFT_388417 [Annulohypoxylon bovei var. microspora]
MLTRAVCQPTPRARSLQTTAVTRSVLRLTSTSLLKAGHRQQIRNFRFGMWSSSLDPEYQRKFRRRHRATIQKYVEAINKSLSWDQRTIDGHPRCGSRIVNHDESNDHQQPARDSRDSRDSPDTKHERVRTPWNGDLEIYFPTLDISNAFKSRMDKTTDQWQASKDARLQGDLYSFLTGSTSAKADPNHKHEYADNMSPEEEYVIDPITNRKVLRRHDDPIEDTASTTSDSFKAYRAQFTAFIPPEGEGNPGPIHSNGPPPPAELKEYGQVKIDQVPPHGVDSDGHRISSLDDNAGSSRKPTIESEEYALNHLPPEESASSEPTKKYEDLDKYKTYGTREAENDSAEVPQNHAELREYKPYLHNESTENEIRPAPYDDLDKYGPYKHDEDVKRDADTSPKYDDLGNYEHYSDEAKKPADDTASKYEDLNKYNAANFQDFFVEERPFQEYGDLEKYRAFKYRELDDKSALEQDIVAESLKDFEAKEQELRSNDADVLKEPGVNQTPSLKTSVSAPIPLSFHQFSRHLPKKAKDWETLERYMDSHNKTSDAADREASSSVRGSRAKYYESQRTLTGNYVRDFPEDFSGSWGTRASHLSSEPELSTSNEQAAHIQAAEKQYADQLSSAMDSKKLETSSDRQQIKSKLEPALDRQEIGATKDTSDHDPMTQAEVDPYSKEPQGLETSYTKECDGEHNSPTFKMYGGDPEPPLVETEASPGVFHLHSSYYRDPELDGRPSASSLEPDFKFEPTRTTEPTVYKILAYDATTQKINMAETSSIVPDHAAPLTPAEVLLRLSNPTKFFPHFAPLQAMGFEIVSGEGDVLVFRQVRHGKVTGDDTGSPVNPIDLMGKSTALPNAAAFVSPTGFVNYDVPKVEEEPQTTPFRSGIDVRREEPVFSGPKVTREEAQKEKKKNKKRGLGKRVLLGGAWVAGISYALGVVGEYFKTGGIDGRGPAGF